MLRSPTASHATLQKERCIMVQQTLGQLLPLFSEQIGENTPLLIHVSMPHGHRNLRLFKA